MSSLQTAPTAQKLILARPVAISGLLDLPVELLDTIFRELRCFSPASLADCVLVCRAWSQLAYPYRFSKIACVLVGDSQFKARPGQQNGAYFQHRCAMPKETTLVELVAFLKATLRVTEHVTSLFLCSSNASGRTPPLKVTQVRDVVAALPSLSSLEVAGFLIGDDLPREPAGTANDSFRRQALQQLSIHMQ